MFPAMLLRYNMGWAEMIVVDVPIFLAATARVCSFYVLSQKEQFADTWKTKLRYIPAVLGIGVGISINNAARRDRGSVRQALRVHAHARSTASRAPATPGSRRPTRASPNWVPYAELALACYFTFISLYVARLRPRRHAALHRDLPVGLPLHLRDVAGAELRLARAASAGGLSARPAKRRIRHGLRTP